LEQSSRDVHVRVERVAKALAVVGDRKTDHICSNALTSGRNSETSPALQYSVCAALARSEWQPELTALQFCLYLVADDILAAAQLIKDKVTCITSGTSIGKVGSQVDTIPVLATELLAILQLLTNSIVERPEPGGDGVSTTQGIKAYFLKQLRSFAAQYRALLPLLAISVRGALLHTALFSQSR
jgi:hypothetical protein